MADSLFFLDAPAGAVGGTYRGRLRADGLDRVLEADAGLDAAYAFRVVPSGPLPSGDFDPEALTFANGETLAAWLWDGGTGPSTALGVEWKAETVPAPTTADPTATTQAVVNLAVLTLPAGATAGLRQGLYRVRVTLADPSSGGEFAVADCSLRLHASPDGPAVARGPAYCSAEDVDDEAPWSADEVGDEQPGGYLREIDKASRWVDREVLARFRVCRVAGAVEWPGMAPRNLAVPWDPILTPNVDFTSDVAAALARGGLDASDALLRRATALYACSLVRARNLDADVREGYRQRAALQLLGWIARIDLDGDGAYELVATAS